MPDTTPAETFASVKKACKKLISERAVYKTKITKTVQHLRGATQNDVTYDRIKSNHDSIKNNLDRIKDLDLQILSLYQEYDIEDLCPDEYEQEADSQGDYEIAVYGAIDEIKSACKPDQQNDARSDGQIIHKTEMRLPDLKLPFFHGTHDRDSFKNFMTQFENNVGSKHNLSDSNKLNYLISLLRSVAFKTIGYLSITDDNYAVGIALLKKEFYNIPKLKDDLISKIRDAKSPNDQNLNTLYNFISEIRANVYDLRTYGVDVLEKDSASCTVMSNIIIYKLPPKFKEKLIMKVSCDYPTIIDLFEHFSAIINQMQKFKQEEGAPAHKFKNNNDSNKTFEYKNGKNDNNNFKRDNKNFKKGFNSENESKPFVSLFHIKNNSYSYKGKKCKFCLENNPSHSTFRCDQYKTYQQRFDRCKVLGLCPICTSLYHVEDCPALVRGLSFPCDICGLKNHVSAMHNESIISPHNSAPSSSSSSQIGNSSLIQKRVQTDRQTLIIIFWLKFHRTFA